MTALDRAADLVHDATCRDNQHDGPESTWPCVEIARAVVEAQAPTPHAITTVEREVLHHINIVSVDGIPMPRLVCTATPGSPCRRRPVDRDVEEWGSDYEGPMGDSECWAVEWTSEVGIDDAVCLTGLAGLVLPDEAVLATIPVDVKYDEGVLATVLTPALDRTAQPAISAEQVEEAARSVVVTCEMHEDATAIDPEVDCDECWRLSKQNARLVIESAGLTVAGESDG